MRDLRMRAERAGLGSNGVRLAVVAIGGEPGSFVSARLEPEAWPEGSPAPSLAVLEPTAAQELMDDLWRCGFRPSEGAGSAGALAATERHLADMRAVAFASLRSNGLEVSP